MFAREVKAPVDGDPPSVLLCGSTYNLDMGELSIIEIEDLKQSVAVLPPESASNLTRETALEVLAQLQSVMLERERLLKELTELGWR